MTMKWMRRKTLCTLVLLMSTPQLTYAAQPQSTAEKPLMTDIALQKGGILVGQVTGKKNEQQIIRIRQNNELVAEVTTGKNGQFMVKGLRGGIYEIISSQGEGSFRAWAEGTAPPAAKQFALLVNSDENVVRGQWGWMPYPSYDLSVGQIAAISAGIAGLVVGTIALVREPDPS